MILASVVFGCYATPTPGARNTGGIGGRHVIANMRALQHALARVVKWLVRVGYRGVRGHEPDLRMRTVAKRLHRRRAATAQRDGRFSTEIDSIALGIGERDRAFDEVGTVRADGDLDVRHAGIFPARGYGPSVGAYGSGLGTRLPGASRPVPGLGLRFVASSCDDEGRDEDREQDVIEVERSMRRTRRIDSSDDEICGTRNPTGLRRARARAQDARARERKCEARAASSRPDRSEYIHDSMIAYALGRTRRAMGIRTSRFVALACCAFVLAACQGNLGSGSGLSIPAAPPFGAAAGPGGPGGAPQSRQRSLDGAVYLDAAMTEIPLPMLDGYGVTIALGTPTPTPSPTPLVSAVPAGSARAAKRAKTRAFAAASPAAVLTPAPSASPTVPTSPQPSASANANAPTSLAASPVRAGTHATASPKIEKTRTKTVVFPTGGPAAPTAEPTGNVQTFATRPAIVRGYILPATTISLYGLGAIRFTIPKAEETTGRGFTIAVFALGRHHRESLVASDTTLLLSGATVASMRTAPALVLKAGTGYHLVLYGDELAPAPGSVPSGYSAPGNNPFVTPYPSAAPRSPGAPGAPAANGAAGVGVGSVPQASVNVNPSATPTPTPAL